MKMNMASIGERNKKYTERVRYKKDLMIVVMKKERIRRKIRNSRRKAHGTKTNNLRIYK